MSYRAVSVWWVVLFLCTFTLTRGSDIIKWPLQRSANLPGDIMLGALFPIHEANSSFECGRIQIEDEGVQQLEALLYTIKKINEDPSILPGIKLGLIALDSCDNSVYALEQSLDFIKGFIARNNVYDSGKEFTCSDGSVPTYRNGSFDRVVGVIGGQSSSVSIQLANLLRLFRVPQISYQSTSPTLSNKGRFEYFFRTVPSDTNQVLAIMEILKRFQWTYVSIVYSDTDYGNRGYEKLQEVAARYNICFSNPQSINAEVNDTKYDTVIQNLMNKSNARVVILFSDKQVAKKLMKAAYRKGASRQFVWIGSDAWGGLKTLFETEGERQVVEGAINVLPKQRILAGFGNYFRKLNPSEHTENPWFAEYWEEFWKCRLQGFPDTPFNRNFTTRCATNTSILTDEFKGLHFVRDAAYAFAYALHNTQRKWCRNQTGLCPKMLERIVDGSELKGALENVTFKDESQKPFRFLPSGDAPPRYTIINFQKVEGKNGRATYVWKPVGSYDPNDDGESHLEIRREEMKFKHDNPNYPRSYCSEACRKDQVMLKLEGDTCCWICSNCSQYQFLRDQNHCADCELGYLPNESKNRCEEIPEVFLDYDNPWAIGSISFASIGMLVVIYISLVFRRFSDTPIIKASGRELSYLLLFGIFLSFSLTFVIVAKPTAVTCGLTRFFLGFCYTTCYAAIVTKTSRIARIFAHGTKGRSHKIRYTSPRSQLLITALLVSVEVIVNVLWLMYDPPDATNIYPTREESVLICARSDDHKYLIGLVYPFILMCFCTVYAFKTRKCPDGFNEARYLTFTNYTTCVVWLAFLPLFVLSTNNAIRAVTLSFLLNLSGTVQIFCLFVPKVYIALFKPSKNTKESIMCHHNRIGQPFCQSSTLSRSTGTLCCNAQLSGSEGHINRFCRDQGGGGGGGGSVGPGGGGGGGGGSCCGGGDAVVALTSLENSKSSIFLVVPQTDAEIQSITSSDSQKETRTRNRSCTERDSKAI
ncbi:metabotropic glutamate receptor 3 [Galendromus occidentalis]|uniref:Metabotropic glutamate receptor 3 n=1 Tax=Galendromus occidentalis TaxID=34638 RepID=A0AAJ7L8J2_9ACAR|nr:metabotropic glutamate receptor 3 [Galendromus occidentalis]